MAKRKTAAHAGRPIKMLESPTYPTEAGGCPRCGHLTLDLMGRPGTYFCPCEDCHPGGVVVRPQQLAKAS